MPSLPVNRLVRLFFAAFFFAALLNAPRTARGDDDASFNGPKTSWHGFDRYDFTMDMKTFEIEPYTAPAAEGDGIQGDTPGKFRCIVVAPRQAAPGNPWSWRGCYWDHQPQTEVELLRRGFYIAYITPDPGPHWDAWYAYLTGKKGFSRKPAFVGMSKGGVDAFEWATEHPDEVSCIYADNPALYPASFAKLGDLVKSDVPLLHVCGSMDFLLEHHTLMVEDVYHMLGGRISIMIKEGMPHHPHSLQDPKPIADWIEENVQPEPGKAPDFPGMTFEKSYFYSYENSYRWFPSEDTYITCRGPAFTDCYDRYDAIGKMWGLTGMAIVMPKTEAPGKPWVFRADRLGHEQPSAVDLGLLGKGFTLVAAPIKGQPGPSQVDWDATYQVMVDHGYAKKPALEGVGASAGEAYAWATQNPEKVACIYAENPVMRSLMLPNVKLLDALAPLARSGVPILHVCGSLDPALGDNSNAVEKQYKLLDGRITVILEDGVGHYPLEPENPQQVVDFMAQSALPRP
ncbi:MAG: alpha/beta hydrolase [Chthoniobacteraceae bacterium]|jgi:pimeloyl-ACP methyl ester carboxylesterase